MQYIDLIGSGGFIGKAIIRNAHHNMMIRSWSHKPYNNEYYFNLNQPDWWSMIFSSNPQNIILLSWPGLPNYFSTHHLTENLVNSIKLVQSLNKLESLVVAGTCYEYGLIHGPLPVSLTTSPVTAYGTAKDALQKALTFSLFKNRNIRLCWARIFYPYGPDQNPSSLYPLLINSKLQGNTTINLEIPTFLEILSLLMRLPEC